MFNWPHFQSMTRKRNEVKVIISKSWTENNSLPTSWKAPFRSGKLQNCFFFLWFSSPLQIVFTLIDTTCLQQAGWNVYIDEMLRKNLSSIFVSFSTFTFLMTGDNYQANVVDKTDHMWQTIFILISGGWGGHHGWKLRVSFSLSLSTLSYGEFFRSYEVASPLGLAIFDRMKWQVPWDLPFLILWSGKSLGTCHFWIQEVASPGTCHFLSYEVASPLGLATF